MKFLVNRKLATRISIITTAITFAGMLLLWFVVSNRAASMVKSNITNQMTDAVESRAAIINDYVACTSTVNHRYADISYMCGIKDTVIILVSLGLIKGVEAEE